MLHTYGKSVAAFVAAVLTAAVPFVAAGHLDAVAKVQIATAVATAVGVYLVPVVPAWPWAKTAVAAVLAALSVASTLIVSGHGHLSVADLVSLVVAALGVLAVHKAPATSLIKPGRPA